MSTPTTGWWSFAWLNWGTEHDEDDDDDDDHGFG